MRTRLAANHRAPLADLLARTAEFTSEERAVALELIDDALAGGGDYRVWVDEDEGRVRGYICYGRTPMTEGTFDLYWVAVDPAVKRGGVGRALVLAMEEEIKAEGGYLVRVETASLDSYDATRAFYEGIAYGVVAQIPDFYARGNDLIIYGRYL